MTGRVLPVIGKSRTLRIHRSRPTRSLLNTGPAIEKVAKILLARNWEQKKAFESGTEWSESANAKYITGEELVTVFVGLQVMAAR